MEVSGFTDIGSTEKYDSERCSIFINDVEKYAQIRQRKIPWHKTIRLRQSKGGYQKLQRIIQYWMGDKMPGYGVSVSVMHIEREKEKIHI